MVRRVLAIVCVLCFVLTIAQAKTPTKITDKSTFEGMFNVASVTLGTSHAILGNNLQSTPGDVNDVYQVVYTTEESFLQYSGPHGTKDITNVVVCYLPSSNASDMNALNYIMLIYEMLCGTGIVEDIDEAPDVLEKLGFFEHLDDGDENQITIKGLSVGYMVSSTIGFWFYVETE